jgi:hypothetical protein
MKKPKWSAGCYNQAVDDCIGELNELAKAYRKLAEDLDIQDHTYLLAVAAGHLGRLKQ